MPHEIVAVIHTYGAEQLSGRRVRKVATTDIPYLERIGWTLARRTGGGSSYSRMYPPEGGDTKRPTIQFTVPTDDEIMALALELHDAGQPWQGEICGWPARYRPRRIERGHRMVYEVDDYETREQIETYENTYPAELRIDNRAPWSATVIWRNGDDAPPHLLVQYEQP